MGRPNYYKARVYDPKIGRFLQTDPIGYGDGLNWYAYVGNDPLNKGDPTGTAADQCSGENHVGCTMGQREEPLSPAQQAGKVIIDTVKDTIASVKNIASGDFGPKDLLNVVSAATLPMGGEGAVGKALIAEKAGASAAQVKLLEAGGGEAIIGAGTNRILNAGEGLAKAYGGLAEDWAKIRSPSFTASDGARIETHAYRNVQTGQTVEPKSIQVYKKRP